MKQDTSTFLTKYKKYFFPIGSIIAGVFIIVVVIIPQISSISDVLEGIRNQRAELSALKSSHAVLTSQPTIELDAGYDTVLTALPREKEVGLIFSALSAAAADSGTVVREFSIEVGGVFGRAAAITPGIAGSPSVGVLVRLGGGDARSFVDFARALQNRLPLSEVVKINISGDSATIDINFFYKPLDLAKIQNQDKILPISKSDNSLLGELSERKE